MLLVTLFVRWLLLAAAVTLTSWLLPGMSLEGGVLSALWVTLLIALVNVVVQAVFRVVPKPSVFLLLAVLVLAVNGFVIWLVAQLSDGLEIDGLLTGVLAAVLISVFSVVLDFLALRLVLGRRTAPAA